MSRDNLRLILQDEHDLNSYGPYCVSQYRAQWYIGPQTRTQFPQMTDHLIFWIFAYVLALAMVLRLFVCQSVSCRRSITTADQIDLDFGTAAALCLSDTLCYTEILVSQK